MERRAHTERAFHPDPPTMLLHNALTNKEAEAHTSETTIVHVRCAVKPFEYARQITLRDPDAPILHVDARLAITLHH